MLNKEPLTNKEVKELRDGISKAEYPIWKDIVGVIIAIAIAGAMIWGLMILISKP